jgi:ribonuclease D
MPDDDGDARDSDVHHYSDTSTNAVPKEGRQDHTRMDTADLNPRELEPSLVEPETTEASTTGADRSMTVEVGFEPPKVEYVTQSSRLEKVLPALLQASALSLDTETTGLDPLVDRLRVIQFATPTHTYIFDAAAIPLPMLTPVLTTVPQLFGHNLKFDLKFLVAAGLPWPRGTLFDTMLAAQLLGAGTVEGTLKACGLAAVVERYLGFTLDKSEQHSDWSGSLSPQQLHYAAVDASVLWPLSQALMTALQAADLVRVMDIKWLCSRISMARTDRIAGE